MGLTNEAQIIDIRFGHRVVFNTASLKSYNEDQEVFVYAHDAAKKVWGQLLMDVANRLPGGLKNDGVLIILKNQALI